jgi:anti-sigma B factor antagonist
MSGVARRFGLVTEPVDSATVLTVSGEVDMGTAPDFEEELARAVDQGLGGGLVVDLSNVSFIDSTGLNALVRALERQRLSGGSLALVTDDSRVAMMLEVTRLDRVLARYGTLGEALSAVETAQ